MRSFRNQEHVGPSVEESLDKFSGAALEGIQNASGSFFSDDQLGKIIAEWRGRVQKAGKPTPYEDPLIRAMLLKPFEEVVAAASEIAGDLPYIQICSIDTGNLCVKVEFEPETKSYTIGFDVRILLLIQAISQILAKSLPTRRTDDYAVADTRLEAISSKIKTPGVALPLAQILECITYGAWAAFDDEFKIEKVNLTHYTVFRDAISTFILGHEIAHILLKHNSDTYSFEVEKEIVNNIGWECTEKYLMWAKEMQADRLGELLSVCSQSAHNNFGLFSLLGGPLFFRTMCLVDSAKTLFIETGDNGSDTHPRYNLRIGAALAGVADYYDLLDLEVDNIGAKLQMWGMWIEEIFLEYNTVASALFKRAGVDRRPPDGSES